LLRNRALGEREALGRLASFAIHAGCSSVCARTGKIVGLGSCCRTGLVHVAPKVCLGRTGGTGTPRILRDSRRCPFGVCSQREKLSGWGAVAALDWCTLLRKCALGEREAMGRLASFGFLAGGSSVCARNDKLSDWVAVAALDSWTLLQNPAWVIWGHFDASPSAGFTQVAVRCMLATGKTVGLGSCFRT
jgi:hypothetical protein